jgi:ubiquinone/menaquinone biosynthesis C-methylase UbiE
MWQLLKPLEGKRVLDIAAGQGDACSPMREAGATVWSLDLSHAMLARGRDRGTVQAGMVVIGNISTGHLPFKDHCFDIAVARYSVHDVKKPAVLFNEVFRVLREGGHFEVVDMSIHTDAPFLLDFYNHLHAHKTTGPVQPCWIRNVHSLEALFTAAGFCEPKKSWYSSEVRTDEWLKEGQVNTLNVLHAILSEATPDVKRYFKLRPTSGGFWAISFPVVVMCGRR